MEEEDEDAEEKTKEENKKEEETPKSKPDEESEEEGLLTAEGGDRDEADELIMQIGSRFAKEKHGHKINEKVAKLVLSGLEAKPVSLVGWKLNQCQKR